MELLFAIGLCCVYVAMMNSATGNLTGEATEVMMIKLTTQLSVAAYRTSTCTYSIEGTKEGSQLQ